MSNDSFYKPSGNIKDTNRTYVPDLYRQVAAEMQDGGGGLEEKPVEAPTHVVKLQNRPIIGVLYSISAGVEGELFPVYVGRNTIGSDLSNDICLRETSVSAQHGILLARKQTNIKGEEYIHVILSDSNSNYGTSLNDEKLNFERAECKDGDILRIGQNYVLVLSLFNALDKLTVAAGFDRIPEPKKVEKVSIPSMENALVGMPMGAAGDHSANITRDEVVHEEASIDFYKPTKQQEEDHYNNKTVIL